MVVQVIHPATEEVIGEYELHRREQVEARLRAADIATARWRATSIDDRAALVRRAAGVLRDRAKDLASLMTREMGKPITGAEAEIEKCAGACDFFAGHAAEFLAEEAIASDATRSSVRFDPLGAVLAIMPWNFPFWQVFRFAAPALMAGNVAVLKHAPNVPGCAKAIEDVFTAAGFPPGVFTNLYLDIAGAEAVIRHPVIRAVTLTGSTRAGRAVASIAGSVLKKTVLELGGSDPFIVIPPASPDIARQAASARCINSGQSCIAAKRFIVVGKNTEAMKFAYDMANAMSRLIVGDPTDPATEVGPMARLDLLETLHDQVRRSVDAGATLLTGGKRLDRRGFFYSPTVLADVRPGMAAFDEETFGPVAAVIGAGDVDEAVSLANNSKYGLGASIWTDDVSLAECIAGRIDAGCVFVNGIVKSDSRLPFGGIKDSGYGRELSVMGIREFVNARTLWVNAR